QAEEAQIEDDGRAEEEAQRQDMRRFDQGIDEDRLTESGAAARAREPLAEREKCHVTLRIADSAIRHPQSAMSLFLPAAAAAPLRCLVRIGAVSGRAGAGRSEEQLAAVGVGDVAPVGAQQRMVAGLVA